MFDDKKPLGSYDDLKSWYRDSSQFCMFHAAAVRPDKCAVHIKEVMDDKGKVVTSDLKVNAGGWESRRCCSCTAGGTLDTGTKTAHQC